MIEKRGYALGSQKIVRYFEHNGRQFVRIEDQVGWSKRDALLTFHLARIAWLLFPEHIPYPRLVRRSSSKPDTYSIFAEFVPHDEEHAFLTRVRTDNGGLIRGSTVAERTRIYTMYDNFNEDPGSVMFEKRLEEAGLIPGFEYHRCNVIMRNNRPVFVDFINPFHVPAKGFKPTWIPRVDFNKIRKYAQKHCNEKQKRVIFSEIENIYNIIPEEERKKFTNLLG
jgi:hypothetical protein